MYHALVRGQVRPLQISVAAVVANEVLGTQVPRLVILEVVIRHESLAALLATVSEVALVHPSNVSPQRNSVPRDQTTQVAGIRDVAVDLHVIVYLRHAFEGFLANRALERTRVTVPHHMLLVPPVQRENCTAYGTFVPRTLAPLFFSSFDVNRSTCDVLACLLLFDRRIRFYLWLRTIVHLGFFFVRCSLDTLPYQLSDFEDSVSNNSNFSAFTFKRNSIAKTSH